MSPAGIEDTYRLSPLQEGMLFHRTLAHDSGVEIFHIVGALEEELDAEAFCRAWQRIVDRYAIYRTSFRWRDREEPVQEVHRQARLEIRQEDWCDRAPREQEELLESFLRADRERGVDLEGPPLIRLALFKRAATAWSFVWTMYHGVVDGRSVRAILIEVFATYEAFCRGEEPESLPIEPFRRYIDWLERQDLAAAEAYWKGLLAGFEAPTPLSTAKVARRLQAAREPHSDREIHLSEATTAALQELCARLGITTHTLLQAAWAMLLGRYSSAQDVVFGCVKSNRAAVPEGKRIIGPLINTLILRVRTPPDLRLDSLFLQVREQWLAHRAHEFVPLAKVQQWSEISPEARLFECLVVFENYRWNEALRGLGGAWANRWLRVRRQPEYPLTLYGFKAKQLALKLIYDRRAFDTTMILRMLGHLERILSAAVASPARRLDEIEILTPAESCQLLTQWNDTGRRFDSVPVHRAFESRAAAHPEAEAVVDSVERLTYAELDRRADLWAGFLIASGVGPEVPVALCLRRSAALVTAALAVLKAGGVYVPLDPSHPPRRLALVLEELGGPLLLTHPELLPELGELGARAVAFAAEPPDSPGTGPRRPTAPEQLAYLIYTSGSTGRPKGVAVTHHSLANLVAWRDTLAVTAADRGALIVNPAFDPWMWELWPYLAAGASLHVPPEQLVLSPAELRDWLIEHAVTGCIVPTPVAELLLALEWPQAPPLRRLLIGGDRLNGRPAAEMGFLTFNNYGPAECTVVATSERVEPRSGEPRPPAIGRPMANVRIYLLDRYGLAVPVGVVGEIFLAGEGLARGYWNRPRETAERFVPDPFSGASGGRLYGTGDLARADFTGKLHFSGRTDHQVKIRGNRVELGEIETHLREHPALCDAIVVQEEQARQRYLVAYCALSSAAHGVGSPDSPELRQFLRQRLPAYMVPAAFVVLAALPRTPHGKVDRRALPAPEALFSTDRSSTPPTTGAEWAVAEVWRQVLGLERIGIDDNFYEAGGHSLALIRMREKLQLRFESRLELLEVMENPTIRQQAELLSRTVAGRAGSYNGSTGAEPV